MHYGAPSTIEDYFQESGHAGWSGEQGISIVFWKPSDAPNYKDTSKPIGMQNWRLSEDTWRTQKNVDVANFCTTLILSWLPHYHRETLRSVVMSVPDLSPLLLSKHLKSNINHRAQTIDLTL